MLVVAVEQGNDHEIGFYDLAHLAGRPGVFPGKIIAGRWQFRPMADWWLQPPWVVVRLFDPVKGELIESLHGHLNGPSASPSPRMGDG